MPRRKPLDWRPGGIPADGDTVLSVADLIKRVGGFKRFAAAMVPVLPATLHIWLRNNAIPPLWVEPAAVAAGLKPVDLRIITREQDRPYCTIGRLYWKMMDWAEIDTETAARIHRQPIETVAGWEHGEEEAPEWAFIDLYRVVTGRIDLNDDVMMVEEAYALTGLNSEKLGPVLGIHPGFIRNWKLGGVPREYRQRIREIGRARAIMEEVTR